MKYNKEEEIKMVRLFRFRNRNPSESKHRYMKIKDIAKFLNKSSTYVSRMCSKIKEEVGRH